MYEWLLYDYYVREKEDENVTHLISKLLHFNKATHKKIFSETAKQNDKFCGGSGITEQQLFMGISK